MRLSLVQYQYQNQNYHLWELRAQHTIWARPTGFPKFTESSPDSIGCRRSFAIPSRAPSPSPSPSRRQGTRLPSRPRRRHAHAATHAGSDETRGQLFGAPFQRRAVPCSCSCSCACAQLILGDADRDARRASAANAQLPYGAAECAAPHRARRRNNGSAH